MIVAFIMFEKKTKNTACLSARWCSVLLLGQKPWGGLDERQHSRAELDQSPSQQESYYMAFCFFLIMCVCVYLTAFTQLHKNSITTYTPFTFA